MRHNRVRSLPLELCVTPAGNKARRQLGSGGRISARERRAIDRIAIGAQPRMRLRGDKLLDLLPETVLFLFAKGIAGALLYIC